MGSYTEIIFGCELLEETPVVVIDALRWMCGDIEEPAILPDHEFFNDQQNRKYLFKGGSHYFGVSMGVAKMWYDINSCSWHICARGNIKNYCHEIEKFLSWVEPYVQSGSGDKNFYAIVCHEDQSEPLVYYKTAF